MLWSTANTFAKRPDKRVIERVALLLACGVKEGTSKQQRHAMENWADAVLKEMNCESLAPRAGSGSFSKSDLAFLLVAGNWALKNPNKSPASFSGVMSKVRSGWTCRSAGKVDGLNPLIFRRLKKGYVETQKQSLANVQRSKDAISFLLSRRYLIARVWRSRG